jgi:hypothetical protein
MQVSGASTHSAHTNTARASNHEILNRNSKFGGAGHTCITSFSMMYPKFSTSCHPHTAAVQFCQKRNSEEEEEEAANQFFGRPMHSPAPKCVPDLKAFTLLNTSNRKTQRTDTAPAYRRRA